jgi:hypothetical protein
MFFISIYKNENLPFVPCVDTYVLSTLPAVSLRSIHGEILTAYPPANNFVAMFGISKNCKPLSCYASSSPCKGRDIVIFRAKSPVTYLLFCFVVLGPFSSRLFSQCRVVENLSK